jgi:hypothetical protein
MFVIFQFISKGLLLAVYVVIALPITFCSYTQVAISERFTVSQAQTLIEAQGLN